MLKASAAYRGKLLKTIIANKFMYLLILPAFLATAIFNYWPMYGVLVAFKNFKLNLGILASPWAKYNGFEYFRLIFKDPDVFQAIKNTLIISLGNLIILFPCYIILALLLNELKNDRYKRTLQSIMYLPHFLSWVIMAGILYNLLSTTAGAYGKITAFLGLEPFQIIGNPDAFRPLVFLSNIWKTAGWGTIIYLAAIAGINLEMYESAIIDGAGRFQRVWHITLPCIKSTMVILLLLQLGNIMNAGFDQIFNLYSPTVYNVGDILDTFVYRQGLENFQFSYSAAVGLFKSLVNLVLLIIANQTVKALGEEGIY